MKKAILILLVLISFSSIGQNGVLRRDQVAPSDTISDHIISANWISFVQNHTTATDLTNYFNKVSDTSDDITEGVTHLFDKTVSFSGGTNVIIGGTYPNFTITDNTLSQAQISAIVGDTANILRAEWLVSINDTADLLRSEWLISINDTADILRAEWLVSIHDSILASEAQLRHDISDSIAAIDMLTQTVSNGDKTASFTHDASVASIGNYNLSTTGAVVISIHNLSSGKQGTIFIDVGASNPSSVTIAGYTDAGSTAISAGNTRGSTTISTTANEMSTCTYTCASDGTNLELILISSTGL